MQPYSNRNIMSHTSAIPCLHAPELLEGQSVHQTKPKSPPHRVQFKDWIYLPKVCPYMTKAIHILQVPSATFSSPYATSHQSRHTNAMTQQTTNSHS